MKIRLKNQIQIEDQLELIDQVYDADLQRKGDFSYLLYQNEEAEKVVLKFNETRLTMTRFSEPKSILTFVKDSQHLVAIPTPLGAQHFLTDTQHYQLSMSDQTLSLHYDLKRPDSDQVFASYRMVIEWGEETL